MLFDFRPKLPVPPEERLWVDDSFAFFVEAFGEERLRAVRPVLPTGDFFDEDFDGKPENVRSVFFKVCRYVSVAPDRLDLQLFADASEEDHDALKNVLPEFQRRSGGAAGYYREGALEDKIVIALKRSKLTDATALIATIAHELCHVLLLGDGKLERDAENMEPMTDLATVFIGMGIFNANAALRFQQHSTGYAVGRLGYIPQEVFGYALAKWSVLRGDNNPAWVKYLSTNVQEYCKRSLKVLRHESGR